jgi:hypothetical protein
MTAQVRPRVRHHSFPEVGFLGPIQGTPDVPHTHQDQCLGVLSDVLKKSSLGSYSFLLVASINVSLRVSGGPHSAEARQAQKHHFRGDDRNFISATSSRTRSNQFTFYF